MTKKSFYIGFIAATVLGCLVYFGFYHKYTYKISYIPQAHHSVWWLAFATEFKARGIHRCESFGVDNANLNQLSWFECSSHVTDEMNNTGRPTETTVHDWAMEQYTKDKNK